MKRNIDAPEIELAVYRRQARASRKKTSTDCAVEVAHYPSFLFKAILLIGFLSVNWRYQKDRLKPELQGLTVDRVLKMNRSAGAVN